MSSPNKPKGIRGIWIVFVVQTILSIAIGIAPYTFLKSEDPNNPNNNSSIYTWMAGMFLVSAIIQAAKDAKEISEANLALATANRDLVDKKFFKQYTENLTSAFAAVANVSQMSPAQITKTQELILSFMADFVTAYNVSGKQDFKASASLMVVEPLPGNYTKSQFFQEVSFADSQRDMSTYSHVLKLKAMSTPLRNVPPNFTLPVDKDPSRVLFGAPKAFTSRRISVIDDKEKIDDLLTHQPKIVADEVKGFFKKMFYRSLVSIPITQQNRCIGVVNL